MGGIQRVPQSRGLTSKIRLDIITNIPQLACLGDEKQRGPKFQRKSVFLTDVMTSVLYQGPAMPNALAFITVCVHVCVHEGGWPLNNSS